MCVARHDFLEGYDFVHTCIFLRVCFRVCMHGYMTFWRVCFCEGLILCNVSIFRVEFSGGYYCHCP